MKNHRSIVVAAAALFVGGAVVGTAPAQWQVTGRVDPRTAPVYPTNRPYSFNSTRSNYDPYQFNWTTGRWDYAPIPYDQSGNGPYHFNWYSGRWDYAPWPAPQSPYQQTPSSDAGAIPAPAPLGSITDRSGPDTSINNNIADPRVGTNGVPVPIHPATQPSQDQDKTDDSELWTPPATQPTAAGQPAPRTMNFEGQLVSIRAVNLHGESIPHVLLRLHGPNNQRATIDVGERLRLPEDEQLHTTPTIITSGKLGYIDGSPVIFADQISIGGSKPEPVIRMTETALAAP